MIQNLNTFEFCHFFELHKLDISLTPQQLVNETVQDKKQLLSFINNIYCKKKIPLSAMTVPNVEPELSGGRALH